MKQYTLAITVFDQAQDASALDILYALAPFLPDRYRVSAFYSDCCGDVKCKRASLSDYIADLRKQRLVLTTGGEIKTPPTRAKAIGDLNLNWPRINFDVQLSPTNAIWHPTDEWPPEIAEQRWRDQDRIMDSECQIRLQDIAAAPTWLYFGVQAEAPGALDADGAAAQIFEHLAQFFPAHLNRSGIYVCCDVTFEREGAAYEDPESAYQRDSAYNVVSHWPGITPMLGGRLDKLHEILIADRAVCQSIHTQLNAVAAFKTLYADLPAAPETDAPGPLAMLLVPRDTARDPACLDAIAEFLAPRDHSTICRAVGWGPGEYRLPSSYYSQWRYDELLAARKIKPPLPRTYELYAPVIASRYMELLGIDPKLMLVHWTFPPNLARDTQSVDAHYDAQPEATPLGWRVWNAYRAMWRRYWTRHSPEFLRFMRDTYFDLDE